MERLNDLTDEISVQAYISAKVNLNNLLYQEESYWKQRAKLFWLAEGDENTKYFHAAASAKRKSNHIDFLMDDNNERVDIHAGMGTIILDNFQKLFANDIGEVTIEQIECPRRITTVENELLTKELTFDEFSLAVKQMHPDKASGPDGLNPAFFQTFLSIMGHEVFKCCSAWLKSGNFPPDLNSTNVVLIPKKNNASRMRDLRTIALCNVLYKIVSKTLANRFRDVLTAVISENQSAFVQVRNITDNVLIVFEMIHHLRLKNRGTESGIALKLDISKAYDRVS